MKLPPGRQLQLGEIVQEGDLYIPNGGYRGLDYDYISVDEAGRIGGKVDSCFKKNYWRPDPATLQPGNWVTDRPPTAEDADAFGEVLIWVPKKGVCIDQWDTLSDEIWMRLPAPPKPQYVVVDGHEVIPQPDGSVKVGCQTITAAFFDEIIRQREAVCGS